MNLKDNNKILCHENIKLTNLKCGCDKETNHHLKINKLLTLPSCDIKELCQLAWNGVPWCIRGKVWRILTVLNLFVKYLI